MDSDIYLSSNLAEMLEEDDTTIEERDEKIDNLLKNYSFLNVLNKIGREVFKSSFLVEYNHIIDFPISDQILFCRAIEHKIKEIYNFEFPIKIILENKEQIKEMYDFIKFIEYDNIIFLQYIWSRLVNTIIKIDIKEFIIKYKENFISLISSYDHKNNLIKQFLNTYEEELLLNWFINISERERILIEVELILSQRERKVS